MTALVLSGSYVETNRFAQQHQLGYGIRHVVSAANLEGRRPTEIHILPSYYKRRDVHAVKAAMKHVFRQNQRVPVTIWDLVDGEYVNPDAPDASFTPKPAPDDSVGAVPGQTAIEEHLEPEPAGRLDMLEAMAADIDDDEVAPAAEDDLPDWLR